MQTTNLNNPSTKKASPADESKFFNAVAKGYVFDIDGTLVDKKDQELDTFFCTRMVNTLRLGRPIIIATGRSIRSAEEMVLRKLLRLIKPQEREYLLKKVFIISNNGSNIFSVKYENSGIIFERELNNELEHGQLIFDELEKKYGDKLENRPGEFSSRFRDGVITLSFPNVESVPGSKDIDFFLITKGFRNFKVLKTGIRTVDILNNDADKQGGIKFLCDKYSLREKEIARFGDQFQEGGNDYEMLRSGIPIPVRNPADALEKLGEVRIAHNVTMSPLKVLNRFEKTRAEQTIIKSQINQNRAKAEEQRKTFQQLGVFYPESFFERLRLTNFGGLRFSLEELDNLDLNSPLSTFAKSGDKISEYFHLDGKYYNSRGRDFFCTDSKITGVNEELERFDLLYSQLTALLKILPSIIEYIQNSGDSLSFRDWKLCLAYFDTLKNYLLHTFHVFSFCLSHELIPKNNENDFVNNQLKSGLASIVQVFFTMFNLKKIDYEEIETFNFNVFVKTLEGMRIELQTHPDQEKIKKSVRGVVEADIPNQVDLFSHLIAQEIIKDHGNEENIVLVGLHFGGIELPYSVMAHLKMLGYTKKVEIISAHFSGYSVPDYTKEKGVFEIALDVKGKTTVLLDDGVFTGSSLGIVCDYLSLLGANVLPRTMQIGTVRRMGHMLREGGVERDFVFGQILPTAIGITPSFKALDQKRLAELERDNQFNLIRERARRKFRTIKT